MQILDPLRSMCASVPGIIRMHKPAVHSNNPSNSQLQDETQRKLSAS